MAKTIYIRFSHNQVGMLIEASQDNLKWSPVELQKYRAFPSQSYNWGSGEVFSTHRPEQAYFDLIQSRGFKAIVVH